MDIEGNIRDIEGRIAAAADRAHRSPDEITLVVVTKTIEPPLIEQAFKAGIRHFGENRTQEAKGKIEKLSSLEPSPTWHLIGHLQTNKTKTAADLFHIIESVDSVRLAEMLSSHALHNLPILLQVNVSGESTKSGFSPDEVPAAVERISGLPNLEIKGLMTIAPLTDNPEEVRPVFRQLRSLRDSLGLEQLSMGMTDDFEVAVEEGATILRVGRAVFSERRE
ncbi:YggS family pyridoxal phosphate-dependent enzyme [Chloroflexota bacterium]